MDTKSKSIKTSGFIKIAAFVVAVIMFFLAGNFASLFIKGFANFNIFANPEDFTNTYVFRDRMNDYTVTVLELGKSSRYQTFDEYLQSEEAKNYSEHYVEEAAKVTAAYDILDASGIEIYVDAQNRYRYALTYNNVRYFFNCSGTPITKEEFEDYLFVRSEAEDVTEAVTQVQETVTQPSADGLLYYSPDGGGGVPEYIRDISNALHNICMVDGHKDYGETTEELILAKIESDRIASIEEIYSRNTGESVSNIVSGVDSVNYAVFYKNSDLVFTNCGVLPGDSEEAVLEKIGVSRWAECCKDGEYRLLAGKKNNTATGTYASLHEWLFGAQKSSLEYSNPTNQYLSVFDDVSAAYFSYNENSGKADSFTIIEKSFESYTKGSLTAYLILTAVCFVIACAACIYLLCTAGRTAEGTRIYFFDKISVEISFCIGFAVVLISGLLTAYITVFELFPFNLTGSDSQINDITFSFFYAISGFSSVVIGLLVAVFFSVWTLFNTSVLRNLRNKTFCRHSLILRPAKWIFKNLWKLSKKGADRLGYVFACDYAKGQGTKFKVLACVIIAVFVAATAFYYTVFVGGFACLGFAEEPLFILFAAVFLILGITGDTAAVAFAVLVIASLHRIMAAASDMRKGNVDIKINTKFMPPFMKRFAGDILSIQDGLQNAVESAVKDQKMKAELITNVSHDLKTPLTSIVNYVDLLKKCEINDETARRYVDVLDEKSHKMKKLIEDLVEASKASSGAVEIRAVKLNLCEFAAQTVGEHEDELKKHGIDVVLRVPEKPVMVVADAQKTMRIAENLFSNIRKYALEGTRVYVDVAQESESGRITFRNISKNPLDVPPEELTRRFVRGDVSRSGEGSGLGLSIAKDLCELQSGSLVLETDGDLFKATVNLPAAK